MTSQRVLSGFAGAILMTVLFLGSGLRESPAGEEAAWGTRHTSIVHAVDPNGRWMILCQARADTNGDGKVHAFLNYHGDTLGDAMEPYLILGGGTGEPIDDHVTYDRSGRYVVVVKKGRLLLLDTQQKTRTDLSTRGAVAKDVPSPFGFHRAASFDALGRQLVYIRKRAARELVVVRTIETGKEAVIDPGPGRLYRARLDALGTHVVLKVVSEDTDGNGKLEWPVPSTTLAPRLCRGRISSYSTFGPARGDRTVTRIAPAAGGTAKTVAGYIAPVDGRLLCRAKDGAIVLRDAKGDPRPVAPARAKARLVVRSIEGSTFILSHEGGEMPGLWLHGLQPALPLKMGIMGEGDEIHRVSRGRWWVRPYDYVLPDRVVDLSTGRIVEAGGDVIHVYGARVLVHHGGAFHVHDVATGKQWKLASGIAVEEEYRWRNTGPAVAGNGVAFDLARPSFLGRYEGHGFGIAADGRVLLATEVTGELPVGPLRLRRPRP